MRSAENRAITLASLLAIACGPAAPEPVVAAPPSVPVSFVQPAVVTPTPPPKAKATLPPLPPPKKTEAAPQGPPPSPEHLLADLFARATGADALRGVVAAPETYRFQVVYGIVKNGTIERHGFRTDAEYFYPASSMKVPIALATYDRWGALRGREPALARDATLRIHPVNGAGEPYVTTLARETLRALVVSDNASANRLLAIVGHREAHETLWSFGLSSVRIRSGFATGADIDPAELSPRIEVGASELPARKSDLAVPPTDAKGLDIGKANIVDGRRVEGPLSFADKNAIRITELQDTLVRIVRPDLLPKGARPSAASDDDLAYLRQTMGTLPSESGLAGYDRNVVQDYRLVPFLRGLERVRARGKFTIQSKVGQAYGFLVSNAYVVEKETNKAFFLTAAVYANPDETMNSDNYAYDSVSFPALADLAEVVARHAWQ